MHCCLSQHDPNWPYLGNAENIKITDGGLWFEKHGLDRMARSLATESPRHPLGIARLVLGMGGTSLRYWSTSLRYWDTSLMYGILVLCMGY